MNEGNIVYQVRGDIDRPNGRVWLGHGRVVSSPDGVLGVLCDNSDGAFLERGMSMWHPTKVDAVGFWIKEVQRTAKGKIDILNSLLDAPDVKTSGR